jgi:predicted nuclease of predicted toxin-antitoxin system
MRILIDECIDERFRNSFSNHDCQTARYAGLAGLQNGELLAAAETAKFEVFLTVDQGIEYQQNLTGRSIAIIIFYTKSNRLKDLPHVIIVDLDVRVLRQIIQRENGRHRADRYAGAAINALSRIYIQLRHFIERPSS